MTTVRTGTALAVAAFFAAAPSYEAAQAPPPGPRVVEAAVSEPRVDPTRDDSRRALFIVGDSTVKNHGAGEGWAISSSGFSIAHVCRY